MAEATAASVKLVINGQSVQLPAGSVVAAALVIAGVNAPRRSVTGLARGPLCGMGVCFECRATIDGQPHLRTCNLLCREGMEVRTDG